MGTPVIDGAELVRRLRDSGTGAAKIQFMRDTLTAVHQKTKRVATSEELIDAMESHPMGAQWNGTVKKARALWKHGTFIEPVAESERNIEDVLSGIDDGTPPEFRDTAPNGDGIIGGLGRDTLEA